MFVTLGEINSRHLHSPEDVFYVLEVAVLRLCNQNLLFSGFFLFVHGKWGNCQKSTIMSKVLPGI